MNELGFFGSTRECLKQFFLHSDWDLARPCLARFAQVDQQTVRAWRDEENRPVGMSLLRVRVFLDLLGYQVEEFSNLPDVARQFGRLVAFDFITLDEARVILKYVKRDGVFDVLLRGGALQRERVYKMERFVEDSSDELDRLTQKFKKQIRDELQLGDEQEPQEENPTVSGMELSESEQLRLEDPVVAAIVSTISSADAVVGMLDFDSQADELVIKIAEKVDFTDLRSLIASLEVIESVVVRGSLEDR